MPLAFQGYTSTGAPVTGQIAFTAATTQASPQKLVPRSMALADSMSTMLLDMYAPD